MPTPPPYLCSLPETVLFPHLIDLNLSITHFLGTQFLSSFLTLLGTLLPTACHASPASHCTHTCLTAGWNLFGHLGRMGSGEAGKTDDHLASATL